MLRRLSKIVESLFPHTMYYCCFQATRIRQWERIVLENIEKLRVIKLYRTPQGLRSFARLFSILLPPLYAPYYASMARDLNSLGAGITFSVLTSIALTALFSTTYTLEDPFVQSCFWDGINVKNELVDEFKPQLLVLRTSFFPNVVDKAETTSGRE